MGPLVRVRRTEAAALLSARGDRLHAWGGRIRNFAFRMIVIKP